MCKNNKYGNNTLLNLGNKAAVGQLSSGEQKGATNISIALTKKSIEDEKQHWIDKEKEQVDRIERLLIEAYNKGYEEGFLDGELA